MRISFLSSVSFPGESGLAEAYSWWSPIQSSLLIPQASHSIMRQPMSGIPSNLHALRGGSGSLSLVVSCLVLLPIPQEVLSQGSLGGCLEAYSWWSPLWSSSLLLRHPTKTSGIPLNPEAYLQILRLLCKSSGILLSPQASREWGQGAYSW